MGKFCVNCGNNLEPSWNVCPVCGHKKNEDFGTAPAQPMEAHNVPIGSPQPQYTQGYPLRQSDKNGIISIILGLIGIFVAGFFLGPLAIYFGAKGLKMDQKPTKAKLGIILGILAIIFYIISVIFFMMNPGVLESYY